MNNDDDNADRDPYDLDRFVDAQAGGVYERVLAELHGGRKRSHWMWYVFPQLVGLGSSAMAERYGIASLDEARAYLAHPILGPRLVECTEALLQLEQGRTAAQVMGYPDDMKLCSCATLFAQVSPPGSVFERALNRYFDGSRDERTLDLLRRGGQGG